MKSLLSLVMILCAGSLAAQQGTLDKSFGDGGIVTTSFKNSSGEAKAIVISPESDIIVAGNEYVGIPSKQCFSVVKYKSNGTLDSTFGKNGKVLSYFSKTFAYTYCAALQSDGKILVGGSMSSDMANYGAYFVLIRYMKNGDLDSSFGHSGLDTTVLKHNIGGEFRSVFIQPDGNIVGVGKSIGKTQDYTAIRYLANGKLDSSFGVNGVATADFRDDYCLGGALQKDGKIIAGGYTYNNRLGRHELMMARFTGAGKIDSSFGKNGLVINGLQVTGSIICHAMALQRDGKIILEGSYFSEDSSIVLARFNSNGEPDRTFGTNGKKFNSFKNRPQVNAMALQADGKIVVAGNVYFQSINKIFFSLARYKRNGDVDSSFGVNGGVQTIHEQGGTAYAVAIQEDGKIVTAGKIYRAMNRIEEYCVIRYNGDKIIQQQLTTDKIKYLNKVLVYPSPARNILHIEGLPSSAKTKITVFDLAGNVAMNYEPSTIGSSYNLNVNKLKPGNYLLRIEIADGVLTKQFVKE